MVGIYADPRISQAAPATVSETTRRILDKINSLIDKELKTISTTCRQMAAEDIGRVLPVNLKYSGVPTAERMRRSKETRSAERPEKRFGRWPNIATMAAYNVARRLKAPGGLTP